MSGPVLLGQRTGGLADDLEQTLGGALAGPVGVELIPSSGDDLGELAGGFPDVVESEIVRTAQIGIA